MEMAGPGLLASVWAPNSEHASYHYLQYDWICGACGFSNFDWRSKCFKCSGSKEETAWKKDYGAVGAPPSHQQENSNLCSSTLPLNSTMEPKNGERHTPHNRNRSLSTSRWAPRNSSGNQWKPKPAEIWTRTVPIQLPTSQPPSSRPTSPIKPTPPDLGLPYEVQHYILALIQRILEEGCYDFAARWIPQMLKDNNWTCSEAVELSNWKRILPAAVPAASLISTSTTASALTESLGHAVRIRNSAVHRHLCDNEELRQMALQAQNLMHIFHDTGREDKFRRLWYALQDWDMGNMDDPDGKRRNLEIALQEIAEKAVDDMDWTPNAVSLEKIEGSDIQSHSDVHTGSECGWEEDEMEID